MAGPGTALLTVAELGEFASFAPEEQRFIETALDLALGHSGAQDLPQPYVEPADLGTRAIAYRELRALRYAVPAPGCASAHEGFLGTLLSASAQDLALEGLNTFAAYRFLYERLLGAAARPWLPASFCGAATLPQIRANRRKALLQSLTETVVMAPGWSVSEPSFYPRTLAAEPA